MIWAAGRVIAEADLSIGVADRTFEHGLGLFETFRTWEGRPALLDRHLARLSRSAAELDLPLDPTALPDARAVSDLLRGDRIEGDAALRITMTGGASASGGSVVWMRSRPLPPPPRREGAILGPVVGSVSLDDPLARYKTLNYWSRRRSHERARGLGADEALLASADGRIWEGTRSNLFLVRGGRLETPGLDGPVLPGVMRALVLAKAADLGINAVEGDVTGRDLDGADELFLTNAVWGIVPVGRSPGRVLEAPGPVTGRLRDAILHDLNRGGDAP